MKRHGKRQPSSTAATAQRPARSPNAAKVRYLRQVHPVPGVQAGALVVAAHLLRRFETEQHKQTPGLSQDAAAFLVRQRWATADLAQRISRAVKSNRGSLITAADLSDT
ncbi:MAG: hypothetical protein ACE5I7_14625 [Candidatus Binatia bacterium]